MVKKIEVDNEKSIILLREINKGMQAIRESESKKGKIIIEMKPLSISQSQAMEVNIYWEIEKFGVEEGLCGEHFT